MIPLGTVPFGTVFKTAQNRQISLAKNSTKRNRPQWYHFSKKPKY